MLGIFSTRAIDGVSKRLVRLYSSFSRLSDEAWLAGIL